MNMNAIIFHTTKLQEIKAFYREKLGLNIGVYNQFGKSVLDSSDTYVNFDLNGMLLCFEQDADRTDVGTVVMHVDDLQAYRERLEREGVKVLGGTQWLKIKDPEGRSLIVESVN